MQLDHVIVYYSKAFQEYTVNAHTRIFDPEMRFVRGLRELNLST